MIVADVKHRARDWVLANLETWPDLVAAHLVGGITTMPEAIEYPAVKDVDIHLVFADDSPMLAPAGPWGTILGEEFKGILIEAGLKPVSEYASPEAVLANPEIAQHLLHESGILYDPDGLLAGLHLDVSAEFNRRQWVQARVDYERSGVSGAVGMLPFAREQFGASGELNILGYTNTFLTAALQLASLRPLRMGGRMFVNMREVLAEYDRLDLYECTLESLGTREVTPEQATEYLARSAEAFDLAITVRRSRFPFDHKLHAHLRPYFVDSCQGMIDEGNHREAFCWIQPFLLCSTDVIQADGSSDQQARFGDLQREFLEYVGFTTVEEREARHRIGEDLRRDVFGLTDQIIATNPLIAA